MTGPAPHTKHRLMNGGTDPSAWTTANGGCNTQAERGRKPVILYGAAKAGLTHYLETVVELGGELLGLAQFGAHLEDGSAGTQPHARRVRLIE